MTQDGGSLLCFGIDVGGTFTDCVLTEGDRVWRAKSPTTPGEIGKGVINSARLAAERRGETLEQTMPKVARFGLGTTAITNVLASRTGRKVGLMTTAGFEHMLPFARGVRIIDGDGWLVTPPSIVDIDAPVVGGVYGYVGLCHLIGDLFPIRVDVANRASLKDGLRERAERDALVAF